MFNFDSFVFVPLEKTYFYKAVQFVEAGNDVLSILYHYNYKSVHNSSDVQLTMEDVNYVCQPHNKRFILVIVGPLAIS